MRADARRFLFRSIACPSGLTPTAEPAAPLSRPAARCVHHPEQLHRSAHDIARSIVNRRPVGLSAPVGAAFIPALVQATGPSAPDVRAVPLLSPTSPAPPGIAAWINRSAQSNNWPSIPIGSRSGHRLNSRFASSAAQRLQPIPESGLRMLPSLQESGGHR